MVKGRGRVLISKPVIELCEQSQPANICGTVFPAGRLRL